MSSSLRHSPADVIRWLLIAKGEGSDPASWIDPTDAAPGNDWPCFTGSEPDAPDDVLTVSDMTPRSTDRKMKGPRGGLVRHHGLQVRIRGGSQNVATQKMETVMRTLAENVFDETVVIEGAKYLVHAVYGLSPTYQGREVPATKRWLIMIACSTTIRPLN